MEEKAGSYRSASPNLSEVHSRETYQRSRTSQRTSSKFIKLDRKFYTATAGMPVTGSPIAKTLRMFLRSQRTDQKHIYRLLGLKRHGTRTRWPPKETAVQTGNSVNTYFTNPQDILCQTIPTNAAIFEIQPTGSVTSPSAQQIFPFQTPCGSMGCRPSSPKQYSPCGETRDRLNDDSTLSRHCSSQTECKVDVSADYWIPAPNSIFSSRTITDDWSTEDNYRRMKLPKKLLPGEEQSD